MSLFPFNFEDETKNLNFNNRWNVVSDGATVATDVSLPYSIGDADADFVDIYTTIPELRFPIDAISFSVFQKNVWVYVDDKLLYEHVAKQSLNNKSPVGSGKVITALPVDSVGKQLHIRFEVVVKSDTGPIPNIMVVDGSDISFSIINKHEPLFALLVSLVSQGLLLLLGAFAYYFMRTYFTTNLGFDSIAYLAIFNVSIACWALCNTKFITIFTDNWSFIHNLEYISFFIFPASIWSFMSHNWSSASKRVRFMSYIMSAFFFITITSKMFLNIDFFVFLKLFHILSILNVIIFAIEAVSGFRSTIVSLKIFCSGFCALAVFSAIDIIRYYTTFTSDSTANLFVVGIVIMTVCLLFSLVFSIKEHLQESYALKNKRDISIIQRRYEILSQNSNDIFFDWDMTNRSVFFTNKYKEYFGIDLKNLDFASNMAESLTDNEDKNDLLNLFKRIEDSSPFEEIQKRFVDVYGVERWFRISITTIFDELKNPVRAIGIFKDVTQTISLEKTLKLQQEYIDLNQELFDFILDADITKDVLIGDSCAQLTSFLGLSSTCSYTTMLNTACEKLVHPDYQEEFMEELSRAKLFLLHESGVYSFQFECPISYMRNHYEWVRYTTRVFISPISNTLKAVSYVKNVHAEKQKEFALLDKSLKDGLTSLYNKVATQNLVTDFLSFDENKSSNHTLMMIDFDDFKNINDTMGHSFGDSVIVEMSNRLSRFFRREDIIGRVGGDEFVVFIKNTSDVNFLTKKATALCDDFFAPHCVDDKTYVVSISIGICQYPLYGTSYEQLFKNADTALYSAKHKGKNTFTFYDDSLIG